ncbi:MAG: undecaprenyldiphospho-muramoylpentapeptide beta-N-acetylglucosaminyltransferase [Candidatus Krumholzibacteriia bacterium]
MTRDPAATGDPAQRPFRLLITGGGTGGHVYPGLAVAEAVARLAPAAEVRFAGTRRGLESVLVPEAGYRLHRVPASGFRGLGPLARVVFMANYAAGILRSIPLLLTWRPAVILGTGGFASAPVMSAGRLVGIPCALQEQNAFPGSANRLLGRWARRVYLGFPSAAPFFRGRACIDTGNPVRGAFIAAAERIGRERGVDGTGRRERTERRILVFGGSRGARTLNRAVRDAAPAWGAREDLSFRIQTGPADAAMVADACRRAGPRFQVEAYIKDMASALDWADLVVCRAGAMTLAEVQVLGKPAVLVPFPHATDDHQLRNAEDCARAGAAVVLEDDRCDGPTLLATVDAILGDPGALETMGRAAAGLARPEAAAVIAADLLATAGHPAGTPAATMGETEERDVVR